MSDRKSHPLFKVHVAKDAALDSLAGVFDSGFINEGVEVGRLTEALKPVLGSDSIVLMNSCTSALTVALRLAGVGPGKNVVTSPMTCIASNTPIINLGAAIKWADIDPLTGMVTPETVAAQIDGNTAAVLFVDWAGVPAPLADLWAVCRKAGVKMIQDAAHAFMAEYQGRPVAQFADFTCFSFQAIKHFTCGDGGALVCADDADRRAAAKLKWFGYDREAAKDEKGNWKAQQAEADILESEVGYKFNMNNVAAAIGLANLPWMEQVVGRHRANAAIYDATFDVHPSIQPIRRPEGSNPAFWVYSAILDPSVDRDGMIEELAKVGIHSGQVHVPNDDYTCFAAYRRDLPGVREFSARQISLPCGWWLDDEDACFIAESTLTLLDTREKRALLG